MIEAHVVVDAVLVDPSGDRWRSTCRHEEVAPGVAAILMLTTVDGGGGFKEHYRAAHDRDADNDDPCWIEQSPNVADEAVDLLVGDVLQRFQASDAVEFLGDAIKATYYVTTPDDRERVIAGSSEATLTQHIKEVAVASPVIEYGGSMRAMFGYELRGLYEPGVMGEAPKRVSAAVGGGAVSHGAKSTANHSAMNNRANQRGAPVLSPLCPFLAAKPPIPWQERGKSTTGSPPYLRVRYGACEMVLH